MFVKITNGMYIYGVSKTENPNAVGVKISEEEYNKILEVISTPREEPPEGKQWALQDLTYDYVLIDIPPTPEPEATIEDYQNSLSELGVDMNE